MTVIPAKAGIHFLTAFYITHVCSETIKESRSTYSVRRSKYSNFGGY